MHRIKKIRSIKPFEITCEWNNGEVRTIQMEDKLLEWADESGSVYKKLLDKKTFMMAELNSETKTLFWDGLIKIVNGNGEMCDAPLDIDPEILYQLSIPAEQISIENAA